VKFVKYIPELYFKSLYATDETQRQWNFISRESVYLNNTFYLWGFKITFKISRLFTAQW